ncbi:MAG: hypothetical protein IPP71_09045 [Bacteroidetes bacterium]|nr:hypothetical protein [Bacteroidota bacterium]
MRLFNKRACIDASVYLEAAENLYKFEPDAEAATRLAQIYIAKGLFGKATSYFNEAFELESDNVKKSILLLELSDHYSINLKNYPQARTYAQRAASLRPNWGRPWIVIGDIYLSGSATCSDEFNGASVYWAATDKYQKAQTVDAAMTEEANHKIAMNSKYYPKPEAILALGMKAGDTYKVKCWINETTTIRVK